MNKIYYLSTCDTCKRILKELDLPEGIDLQDIKKNSISERELDFLKNTIGSYEKLFNKRSQLYKQRNLKDQNLTENDYRNLILEHYTFLIRPVIVVDNQIFAGNSPKVILEVKNKLQSLHNQ
ncbi:arsenate reductase family protein [Capnocytophaga cynodegmi]|uniref:Putative Arsenate reductase (Glutaredoxin) n=1 Tax=Capnocytophaga cynodegmi TaxID=28189 RepID=A0A0B7HLJ5_9FLAO|nr:ArsC/Spx/MgsR family protein [Capnocytophaga cynodegmi]CEN38722.1 putative Arsenate reductase (glutaredoxin) [Capnocytophaga cynodegmi]